MTVEKDQPGVVKQAHSHEGQEFDYVLEGYLRIILGGNELLLAPGDSVYYDSSLPHVMYAPEGDCRFIAVVIKAGEYGSRAGLGIRRKKDGRMKPLYREYLDVEGDFLNYEDFNKNFRLKKVEGFNFAYDVVDRYGGRIRSARPCCGRIRRGTWSATISAG